MFSLAKSDARFISSITYPGHLAVASLSAPVIQPVLSFLELERSLSLSLSDKPIRLPERKKIVRGEKIVQIFVASISRLFLYPLSRKYGN